MALTRILLANHWISASLALEALDRYVETRIPLGRLALAEGILKMGPLLHILDEQLEEGSVGDSRRFGEIAVALGYLDDVHVEALLAVQREVAPSFEQILIELGAFAGVTERGGDAPRPEAESAKPPGRRSRVEWAGVQSRGEPPWPAHSTPRPGSR